MPRTLRTAFVCCFAVALACLGALQPSVAHAQSGKLSSGGIDLRGYRPPVDSKGHLSVNGSQVLGNRQFAFGLILDAGLKLLPYDGFVNSDETPAANAERRDYIVDQAFTGTLQAAYGIANRFVVGLQAPFVIINGENVTIPGVLGDGSPTEGLSYQSLGDLSLFVKAQLVRMGLRGAGLGAIVQLTLPTGDERRFAGNPGVSLWPMLAVDLKPAEAVRFSVNGGYRWVSKDGTVFPLDGRTTPGATNATAPRITDAGTSIQYGDAITAGAALSVRVVPAVDLVAEVYGSKLVDDFSKGRSLSAETIGGMKIFVDGNSHLLLGAGIGITDGLLSPRVRGVLGFIFEPSIGDRDGDGIPDDLDKCPDDPEDFDGFEDEDGCPDPDNDGDGILDVDDKCPDIPEDFDGVEDEDGCPDGTTGDRDGDGILDKDDKCPDDPEDFDGFEDEDGCPDPDNDKDGILDRNDKCPNDPEDFDGFEDEDGCPDHDNDQDRILDKQDACPNDPETYNGFKDEDGCPDKGSVIVEGNDILILEKIYFETDSARILPRSFPIVDAVAATLKGNPQIRRIEIQGHADERGADKYNLDLTQARSESVMQALVERGVEPGRVRAAGYGERCPVDRGHNENAWEKNRRVEFKILETDQGPTNVVLACPAGQSLIPKD